MEAATALGKILDSGTMTRLRMFEDLERLIGRFLHVFDDILRVTRSQEFGKG